MSTTRTTRHHTQGRAVQDSSHSPPSTRTRVAPVVTWPEAAPARDSQVRVTRTPAPITRPAGTARRSTRPRKPGR